VGERQFQGELAPPLCVVFGYGASGVAAQRRSHLD